MAYALFVSLRVLREPSKCGLRGAWAKGVRARLPTVLHHLDALRLAELVYLTLGVKDKWHFATRPEAIKVTFATLEAFVGDGGKKDPGSAH